MFKSVVALGVLSMVAVSAQAGVEVRASLTGFSFQLIDLDVSDGIAPAVTFTGGRSDGTASNLLSDQSTTYDVVGYRTPFQSDSRSATLGPFTSAFELKGVGGLNGYNLEANAKASNAVAEPWTSMFGNASMSAEFALTPRTQLVVSVVGMASVQSSMLASRYLNDITAQAWVNLEGYGLQGGLWQSATDDVSISVPSDIWSVDEHQQKAMTLAFSNETSITRFGTLTAYARTRQYVSDVPEPASSQLLISGVALLGLLATRRRTGN